MDVIKHLHMNGGTGETSYSVNSLLQRKAIEKTKHIVEAAVVDTMNDTVALKSTTLSIADLGCSSGPNTLMVTTHVTDIIHNICQQSNRASPQIFMFLNDLPSNDFNTLFMSLPSFYDKLKETKGDGFGPCFVVGVPGTFYGRLFPNQSLQFIHSSYSLHWLSQVPRGIEAINKGTIWMAESSPPSVRKAYFEQFQTDFSMFLRSRSEELVRGGRMVFTVIGKTSEDPLGRDLSYLMEPIEDALTHMLEKGMINKEKLDSFNLPVYFPSPAEIMNAIEINGSFVVNQLETFHIHWDHQFGSLDVFDKFKSSSNVANFIRSVLESLLVTHFGEALSIDQVINRCRQIIEDRISETDNYVNLVVSLRKS